MNKVELLKTLSKDFVTVAYDKEWANGTGYFDGAMNDSSITAPSKFEDEFGRFGVIIPMKDGSGNLVVFQRRLGGDIITVNKADSIREVEEKVYTVNPNIDICSSLTEETIKAIFVGEDSLMHYMGY